MARVHWHQPDSMDTSMWRWQIFRNKQYWLRVEQWWCWLEWTFVDSLSLHLRTDQRSPSKWMWIEACHKITIIQYQCPMFKNSKLNKTVHSINFATSHNVHLFNQVCYILECLFNQLHYIPECSFIQFCYIPECSFNQLCYNLRMLVQSILLHSRMFIHSTLLHLRMFI